MAAKGGLGDIMQAIGAFVESCVSDMGLIAERISQPPEPMEGFRVLVAILGIWMITSGVQLIIKDYQMTTNRR
jgi:uncharacterized membrane protein HdeD (DUF308 family)